MSFDTASRFTTFSGSGEMAGLCRHYDWNSSVLGSPESWPEALKTVLGICLDSHFPIAVWWGPELIQFYNDAYRPILGATKHPTALGAAAKTTWPEIWTTIGPMVENVIGKGDTVKGEDMPLYLDRNGYPELCYFTFSYSPIRDQFGKPIGMFTAAVETTAKVFSEQRQALQIQLYDRIRGISDPNEITAAACRFLGQYMRATRVGYSTINDTAQELHVAQCWTDGTLETAKGLDLQLEYIGRDVVNDLRHGKTVLIEDIDADTRSSEVLATYLQLGVKAMLLVPVIRGGELRAIMSVGNALRRRWNKEEIQLAEDVSERVGATIERVLSDFSLRKKILSDRDQLSSLLNNAPSFMALLIGPDHTFEITNSAYQKLIGDREVIGKTVKQALPEAEAQGFIAKLDEVFSTGKIYSAKDAEVFVLKDAKQLEAKQYIDFIYQPFTDAEGKTVGVFVEGFDVTDRKHATDGLKEANRRKDEFLAMLAHELRNPLAPIRSAADLLSIAKLDEERVKKTSAIISRQVKHMTSLIDDLLDVSRVTRGLVTLEKTELDIKRIVADAVEQVRPLMESRRHRFAVDLSPESTYVLGDQKRLVQVLTNLLNNAVKFTPEGGSLALRMEVAEKHIYLTVKDNGIGMSSETAERAFDLFSQAEQTSDRTQGGLGIGLALVKTLMGLHGGSVHAASAGVGAGSEFTICFPRIDNVNGLAINESVKTVVPSTGLRLLIVDDNVDAANVLAMLLEATGHVVTVEHDSKRGLARARMEVPDVCLLDIGLPDMDGYELARRLRSQPETMNCRLIAITGYGQESDRKSTAEAGFDHHFVKPIDAYQIMELLRGFT